MPSSTEPPTRSQSVPGRGWSEVCQRWNRRLHYLVGLYLLFFVWLFAFTGLLLNHGGWRFAEFWENRRQARFDREIARPIGEGDLAQARDLMSQLGLRGEIEWTAAPGDGQRLDFRVSRPGHIFEIKADFANHRATVERIEFNAWGAMRVLHTFTGVRLDDARNRRDWLLTSVWALTMDAVAVGLIFLVLTSLYLWYGLRSRRQAGGIALALGFVTCGLFCIGLRWLC